MRRLVSSRCGMVYADAMRGPWNDDQVARIKTMRAFSAGNAPLPSGNAKYPVVVFAPVGGMKGLTYHVLLEDLASHGWVVAARCRETGSSLLRKSLGL
ncbi:MAG: hypothetical protein ACRD44_09080 [Bryobacteraceae bacterium]